jgi:MFS family permease
MAGPSSRTRAQIVATLAALQTGIEPATLTLLVANRAVSPVDFGWIVSVGQIGMAGGALLGWRQDNPGRSRTPIAPAVAVAASLALTVAHGLFEVLALRLVLGIVMGLLLTHATAIAARQRPHNAIGIIILAQQLLSTAVLAGLPVVAAAWGPGAALGTLTATPLVIALMLLLPTEDVAIASARGTAVCPGEAAVRDTTHGSAVVPMALIVAVTMMLWSYIATIGSTLHLHEADIDFAIALGSLASAPAAVLAAFFGPRLPPWLTALVCGAGILSPLSIPVEAGLTSYLITLALFNAGSTFGAIRFTAWAMRGQTDQRRFAAMVQCVAMSAGPAMGAVAMRARGLSSLGELATAGVAIAIVVSAVCKIDGAQQPAPDVVLIA